MRLWQTSGQLASTGLHSHQTTNRHFPQFFSNVISNSNSCLIKRQRHVCVGRSLNPTEFLPRAGVTKLYVGVKRCSGKMRSKEEQMAAATDALLEDESSFKQAVYLCSL